jgi:NADH:ubiquinone reductase (H+-translocating)
LARESSWSILANRVLGSFPEHLCDAAKKRLEKLGVEIRLGHGVDQIDEDSVIVAGERISSKTVIWTAGVAPSPAGRWLKVETNLAGRVRVKNDLTSCRACLLLILRELLSLACDLES